MNPYQKTLFLGVATLLIILGTHLAVATPPLSCANFTGDKHSDCQYIRSEGLTQSQEQELLWILWGQSYDADRYHPPVNQPLDTDLSLSYEEIDTSRFILASKITIFFIFNYFLVSLTKWSVIARCLPAV